MSKKRIELFRASRRPIESEFAQGMFWFRAHENPDFETIRNAYVDGVLLASLASKAADLANRVEVPDGATLDLVPLQGTRTPTDSDDLRQLIDRLRAASKKVRPLIEDHWSSRSTNDHLATRSSYLIDVLNRLRSLARKRRRRGRIEETHARTAMQDVVEKREVLTYEIVGQRFDLDAGRVLGLVLGRADLVQAVVNYCNGGSVLTLAAKILAAEQGTENITRDVLRAARGRVRRAKSR